MIEDVPYAVGRYHAPTRYPKRIHNFLIDKQVVFSDHGPCFFGAQRGRMKQNEGQRKTSSTKHFGNI